MGKKVKERVISEAEYLARLEQGVPVGNCWVDMGNGQLAYALQEVVAVGVPFNKYGDKFCNIYAVNFCVADNTRIDTQKRDTQISAVGKQIEFDRKKKDVKERLSKAVSTYFSKEKAKSFGIEPECQARVKELEVKETLLSVAIARDMDLSYEAFPYDFYIQNQQLLNDFFQLRELPEKTDDGKPGFLESLIPVVGSAKEAEYNFDKGNYWAGIGYSLLAISDVFLVKSIAAGIAKGGFKALGKSYTSWNSYRRFYGKQRFAKPNQHLHHWLWQRNGATKGYGFKWWAKNQMWNLKPVPKIEGMSFDAVHKAIEGKGLSNWTIIQRMYYGTPSWPWTFSISAGGRITGEINDE
jgi:hypothetical protein